MATFVCLLGYILVQQDIRMGANDPQIQIAEDSARALEMGASLSSIMPTYRDDMAASLAPYIVLYDAQGHVLASSVVLHGIVPIVPNGVFVRAKQSGETRITWQPESGVRSAIVIASFEGGGGSGFVLVGRSLREVEKREDNLLSIVGVAWIAALIFFFGLAYLLVRVYKKTIPHIS